MTNTTEMLKVHGFTNVDEVRNEPEDRFITDINQVLPGRMFVVYDARADNPGYYVVENMELTEYTEA